MVGVGEDHGEISELMRDAATCGAEVMTIGQYLQPSHRHHPVRRYYTPEEFHHLAALGRRLGLAWVEASPLVRSSYHARQQSDCFQAGRGHPYEAEGSA
jgi:lipoic acid synthetase